MHEWIRGSILATILKPLFNLVSKSSTKESSPADMEKDVIDISSSDGELADEDDFILDGLFTEEDSDDGEVSRPSVPDSERRILPSYMSNDYKTTTNPGPSFTSREYGMPMNPGPSSRSPNYGTMANSAPQLQSMPSSFPFPLATLQEMDQRGIFVNGGNMDYQRQEPSTVASSSQYAGKRALPLSLQPGVSRNAMHGSKGKSSQFNNVPLKPLKNDSDDSDEELLVLETHDAVRPAAKYATGAYPSGNFGAGSSTGMAGVLMGGGVNNPDHNVATTNRMLPPWMNGKNDHGRYSTSSQHAGTGDGREHPTVGEPGLMEFDERLIYETVLQDLAQPKIEIELDNGLLAVPLLRHQKIALAWMEQKERTSRPCSGGILADDQGLGKTVSMIALILKQMPLQKKFTSSQSVDIKPEMLNLDEDESFKSAHLKPETLHLSGNDHLELADRKPKILTSGDGESQNFQIEKKDFIKDHSILSMVVSTSNSLKGRPAAGTLVVCPASILRQWSRELDEKVCDNSKLSVKIYHGSSRTKCPSELAKYDVVLTTYAIISNEVPKQPSAGDDDGDRRNPEDYGLTTDFSNDRKRKASSQAKNKKKKKGKGDDLDSAGPLSKVRWFRVILDEAQVIKNHRTQVARACCGLRAKTRWCLSGTPLQNAVEDLYSYFRFLKYDPYAKYSSFCSALKYPIFRDAVTGYKKLQAVLRAVMLRRTKDTTLDGQPILKLPPKSISLKKLCFSVEERSFYAGLEANFRDRFKAYAAEGTVKQNYANILIMLLRLRQACDHPLLVKDYDSSSSGKTSIEVAKALPKETLLYLLSMLDASSAICAICNDSPEDAVVTLCGHVYCYQCISESLTGEGNLCPAAGCHAVLDPDSLFSRGTLRCCVPDELGPSNVTTLDFEVSTMWSEGFISTKIKAALKILIVLQSRNSTSNAIGMEEHIGVDSTSGSVTDGYDCVGPTNSLSSKLPEKAIVFSQWTGMLDLLEVSLNHSLIEYRRLDGSMSLVSRDKAVKDFNTDPEVTVMIMSLKSGNLGLNMVAACHVILLDLWWNPTSEDQAVDRAHRIGQTRPVCVHRLTIEDTLEERILQLQEKKRDMVSSAFGEDTSGKKSATRLTMEDLRYLFQV